MPRLFGVSDVEQEGGGSREELLNRCEVGLPWRRIVKRVSRRYAQRNGPAGTPACPPSGGTVTGTITAASVIGPTAQNVTPGDFDALTDALIFNTAYGSIHTTKFPAGEIRGQLRRGDGEDE